MIYTHVAAAIAGAALAAVGTWQVQNWRWSGQVAEIKRVHAEGVRLAEQATRARERALVVAKNESEARYVELKNRSDRAAAGARDELGRLRDELAARGRAAPQNPAAFPRVDAATAERELLGQCAQSLVSVAADADRLAAQLIGLQAYVSNVCLAK